MKISPHPQGSLEWMQARAGVVTASQFDQIVDTSFTARAGAMPRTYLAKLLAEYWIGGALAEFSSYDMEQGQILEEHAIPWYALAYDTDIQRVGLITTDDGRIGCSPDGLIGDDGGIEIKCPAVHTHVAWLIGGKLPKEHAPQVHGGMLVTGRPWWKFVSYRRSFPALVLTIERDEKIIGALREALDAFLERLEDAKKHLITLNGGLPRRFQRTPDFPDMQSQPSFVDDPRITVLN